MEDMVKVMPDFAATRDFWRGRSVYVTGLSGFKGTWLGLMLHRLGASVSGCGLPMPRPFAMMDQVDLGTLVDLRMIDIRDRSALHAHMAEARPEFLFHLAAQSQVKDGYTDPVGTFDVNVVGTALVLDVARTLDHLAAIVVVSSDKCYENLQRDTPYSETDRLGGNDPYSASKGCTELVAGSFRSSFFSGKSPALATARAGNVIGGGDWASWRLLPDAVRAFSKRQELVLRRPDAIRPWQFVLNSLIGYLMLARALAEHGQQYARAWNFGPAQQNPATVETVVEKFAGRFASSALWTIDRASSLDHEEKTLLLDSNAAHARLGWAPNDNLDDAIEAASAWYRRWADGASIEDMRSLSNEQVDWWLSVAAVSREVVQ